MKNGTICSVACGEKYGIEAMHVLQDTVSGCGSFSEKLLLPLPDAATMPENSDALKLYGYQRQRDICEEVFEYKTELELVDARVRYY